MTRFGSVVICAALGAGLFACGSSGSGSGSSGGIEDLFPRNNTVTGWTVDQSDSNSIARDKVAAVATTKDQAEVDFQLDGAVEPFYTGFSPTKFAMQSYVNSTGDGSVLLYVVQMPSTDQASGLYGSLLSNSLYSSNVWEDPSSPVVGTASRITDTGATWWINFYKGVYYVQLKLKPSNGDATTKSETFTFAQAIAGKI